MKNRSLLSRLTAPRESGYNTRDIIIQPWSVMMTSILSRLRLLAFASLSLIVTSGVAVAQDVVHVPTAIPFDNDLIVRDAIRAECELPEKLAMFIREYAEGGVTIKDADEPPASGKFLKASIIDIQAPGGGAFSGPKTVTIKGVLIEDGVEGPSFQARRISGGGAFAGFKGTCDILGRDVKALGSDVANWLVAPRDNARLGDL